MSNEELVAAVQAGDREKLVPLWSGVRRLVLKQARRWAGGAELEDLEQAGFLALLDAVEGFDCSAGYRFSTWLFPAMKREFTAAAGLRTERERRDPIRGAVSLDEPVPGEDGDASTLGDLLPDPAAEAAVLEVTERDYADRRSAAVEAAVSTLTPEQREAVRGKYWREERVDSRALAAALRHLRHPSRSRALREYW